jgi:5-methylcytosine-specific restriction enzyme A
MLLSNLRGRAYATLPPQENPTLQTILERRKRSQDVKVYVFSRAGELCEACSANAPFRRVDGSPFLEVHHIDRISDGGLDLPDRVAAICPNCHRRCHFGNDRVEYNRILRQKIVTIERSLDEQI